MKKLFSICCTAILLVCTLCLFGCDKQKSSVTVDGNYVMFTVKAANIGGSGTMKEYMDYLQENEELTYEIKDGAVISINGKKSDTGLSWSLYSNDGANAISSKTCEYKGNYYYLAKSMVGELPIKDGGFYIWYLQTA